MTPSNVWTYRDLSWTNRELAGFEVEALDGSIGKIDEATDETGNAFVVVDTGPWIFGKKVMLPAGVIQQVDVDAEQVFVNRTKDEIKNAPEYDADRATDETFRSDLGAYYGVGGVGYRNASDRYG